MEDYYFIYDDPYDYKGIKIYPVTMRNYLEFNSCISCLLLEKNREPDIDIIRMTYLDYLFLIQSRSQDNKVFLDMVQYLLLMVLRDQYYEFWKDIDGKYYFTINQNNDVKYYGHDFDNIKEIILKQNGINHEEIFLDEKIEQALKDAQEYKSKHSIKFADLEEQMITYHLYNGYDYEKIYNLTIRKFNKTIQRMMLMEDYKILKTAEVSGVVEFKEEIKYFLSHIEPQGRFDGLVVKDAEKTLGNLKDNFK
jgi:hypothetical protein